MSSSKGETWTVLRMLEWGTQWFADKNVASPRLSIEWLVASALHTKRLNLYVQFDRPFTSAELAIIRDFVKRRTRHEPLQYITGSTSFYNSEIKVAPGVLIPRPETEELVEHILNNHDHKPTRILDIGTGSGCIAVALAKERPEWEVHGIDLSNDALEIARHNAESNSVAVKFANADLFRLHEMGTHQWDVIVSNPPYIHHDEAGELDPQVKNYEPAMALFCENRSSVYEHIAAYAQATLNEAGKLYFELHLEHEIEKEPFFCRDLCNVTIHSDMSDRRRFAEIFFHQK